MAPSLLEANLCAAIDAIDREAETNIAGVDDMMVRTAQVHDLKARHGSGIRGSRCHSHLTDSSVCRNIGSSEKLISLVSSEGRSVRLDPVLRLRLWAGNQLTVVLLESLVVRALRIWQVLLKFWTLSNPTQVTSVHPRDDRIRDVASFRRQGQGQPFFTPS